MKSHFVVVEGCVARAGRAAVGLVALLGLVALAPVPARADAVSSPGKVTAVRSAIGLTVDNGSLPKTVQLVKGKRRYLLVVSGVLSGFALTPWTDIGLGATVNGVDFEPFDANLSRVFQQCGSSPSGGHCTVSGTWFVDLDAMEAAHPGMFVNMPLSVTMNPQAFGGQLTGAKLSLTAMLVKK
jgi:hypothetical protein